MIDVKSIVTEGDREDSSAGTNAQGMRYAVGARDRVASGPTGIASLPRSRRSSRSRHASLPEQGLVGRDQVGGLGLLGAFLRAQTGVDHEWRVCPIVNPPADAERAEAAVASCSTVGRPARPAGCTATAEAPACAAAISAIAAIAAEVLTPRSPSLLH